MTHRIDQTAIKFGQASFAILILLAFLLDLTWLALLVGAVLAIGAIWPEANLFKQMAHV